jgi:hypothetical protein
MLSGGGSFAKPFGGARDQFVSGDFDGDGKTDIAVYGPYGPGGIGRVAVQESGGGTINMPFGGPADTPLPPPIVPTSMRAAAFVRSAAGAFMEPGVSPPGFGAFAVIDVSTPAPQTVRPFAKERPEP